MIQTQPPLLPAPKRNGSSSRSAVPGLGGANIARPPHLARHANTERYESWFVSYRSHDLGNWPMNGAFDSFSSDWDLHLVFLSIEVHDVWVRFGCRMGECHQYSSHLSIWDIYWEG